MDFESALANPYVIKLLYDLKVNKNKYINKNLCTGTCKYRDFAGFEPAFMGDYPVNIFCFQKVGLRHVVGSLHVFKSIDSLLAISKRA